MHSLRRRLEESIWASKKAFWAGCYFGSHIIKHGDERQGTSGFLLGLLYSALAAG